MPFEFSPDKYFSYGTPIKIEHVEADSNLQNRSTSPPLALNSESVFFSSGQQFALSFLQALKEKGEHFKNVKDTDLIKYFSAGVKHLTARGFAPILAELTGAVSIYFFSTGKGYNIYLEFFFDELTGKFTASTINVYQNGKQILSDCGTVYSVMEMLDQHVHMDLSEIFQSFTQLNSIPETASTFPTV